MNFVQKTYEALAKQRRVCLDPDVYCIRVLRDLLSQAEGTQFGVDFGISNTMTTADFQNTVPISKHF